jgi:hypothetical protein
VDNSTPNTTPETIPQTPINTPCTANTASTLAGPQPKVRKIAISDCFSFTIMTNVATMLKAATATTINKITNSIDLVIWIERKKLAWLRVQSLI